MKKLLTILFIFIVTISNGQIYVSTIRDTVMLSDGKIKYVIIKSNFIFLKENRVIAETNFVDTFYINNINKKQKYLITGK